MLHLGWNTEDEAAEFVEAYQEAMKKIKKKRAQKTRGSKAKKQQPKKKRIRTREQAAVHKWEQRARQDPVQRAETARRQRERYKAKKKAERAEAQAALQDLLAEMDKQ